MKIIVIAAAAAAFVASMPAQAAERMPVSVRVQHADLNLNNVQGRETLARRIDTAARQACGMNMASLRDMGDARRCHREMVADGSAKLAALRGESTVQLAAR